MRVHVADCPKEVRDQLFMNEAQGPTTHLDHTPPPGRCNIEGYNGMHPKWSNATRHMLSEMPAGRCPYPPGDRSGMLGFSRTGHYIGGVS